MGADGEFFGQVAVPEDFDSGTRSIGQPRFLQSRKIYFRVVRKLVERLDVHGDVDRGVAGVVKTALGNAADEGHLAAFKADPNRTAGTGGLALAAASAGFSVAAGFALTQPLAAVLGTRTGLEIM